MKNNIVISKNLLGIAGRVHFYFIFYDDLFSVIFLFLPAFFVCKNRLASRFFHQLSRLSAYFVKNRHLVPFTPMIFISTK